MTGLPPDVSIDPTSAQQTKVAASDLALAMDGMVPDGPVDYANPEYGLAWKGRSFPFPPVSVRCPAAKFGVACLSALLVLGLAEPVRSDDSDLCLLAAQDASRLSGVPLSVLIAVTLTETGRSQDGTRRPWPWTVNMEGEGHWFATRDEALAFAQARQAAGAESFDLGCFQINWMWHHENFVSVDQMFDPLANATYAASFLKTLAEEKGGWSEAAGAFHSRTPELAARYRAVFEENLTAAQAAGVDDGALAGPFAAESTQLARGEEPGVPRVNTFPLLKPAGGPLRLGSLVPLGDG